MIAITAAPLDCRRRYVSGGGRRAAFGGTRASIRQSVRDAVEGFSDLCAVVAFWQRCAPSASEFEVLAGTLLIAQTSISVGEAQVERGEEAFHGRSGGMEPVLGDRLHGSERLEIPGQFVWVFVLDVGEVVSDRAPPMEGVSVASDLGPQCLQERPSAAAIVLLPERDRLTEPSHHQVGSPRRSGISPRRVPSGQGSWEARSSKGAGRKGTT
jgi:hypothetical protein